MASHQTFCGSDYKRVEWVKLLTDLIARADHDMRSAEKAGDGRGVGMKQTLLHLGNTISAPVDLHVLGKIALIMKISSELS